MRDVALCGTDPLIKTAFEPLHSCPLVFIRGLDYMDWAQRGQEAAQRIFAASSANSERSPFWSSMWAATVSVRNRLTT